MLYPLKTKNPDILMCLANLSSDEVFTSPKVANEMLDLLPQSLFRNPFAKFLDPACKSGVFLREIVRRLITGLADKFPDLQARVNHIMRYQVFGIALTDLTAMMSRRTVYCSMNVQSRYSVCTFPDEEGRVRFRRCAHTFGKDGKCGYCGMSEKADTGEESHAYEFIHTERPEEILGMRFDVVISNPPYQMSDGGFGASAKPMYQLFVEQAKKLNPKHIVMIIPARWYTGGKGLDDFRREMLNDRHIRVLHDFPEGKECFGEVQIKGGVCYFRWDRDSEGNCEITNHRGENISVMTRPLIEEGINTFIRYNEAVSILQKVRSFHEESFSELVSQSKPFGLRTFFHGEKQKTSPDMLKCYGNKRVSYVSRGDITQNTGWIDSWKVYISRAYGAGDDFPHQIINVPFIGEPETVCTETYMLIGPFGSREFCDNVISYMATKFFRFLVMLKKNTQDATSKVYTLVPMQDFSRPWSDPELYAKYSLTPEETAFIDSMIRPMTTKEASPNAQ